MTASVAERRIKKELAKLRKAGDEVGMTVEVGASSTEWFVTIVGERERDAVRTAVGLIQTFGRGMTCSERVDARGGWLQCTCCGHYLFSCEGEKLGGERVLAML